MEPWAIEDGVGAAVGDTKVGGSTEGSPAYLIEVLPEQTAQQPVEWNGVERHRLHNVQPRTGGALGEAQQRGWGAASTPINLIGS